MTLNPINKIALLGAGGHGKVVADIVELSGVSLANVFDEAAKPGQQLLGHAVEALPDDISLLECAWIMAIGDNTIRRRKFLAFLEQGAAFAVATHPRACIAKSSSLAEGSVVMAGAVINPGVVIGKNVIINTSASVDHDCQIGDHAHIAPNATLCGNVTVGESTWVGAGATVIEGIKIGMNALVGAGAVVIDDVPDGAMVLGVPARIINQKEK